MLAHYGCVDDAALVRDPNIAQHGGSLRTSITEMADLRVKVDKRSQELALSTSALEANLDVRVTSNWTVSAGVRKDDRTDHSPVVPLTQVQGERTDVVARLTCDSRENGPPMAMPRRRSVPPAIAKPTPDWVPTDLTGSAIAFAQAARSRAAISDWARVLAPSTCIPTAPRRI